MIEGRINTVETFGSVDGPGVRFIFFMQGCPLRCGYCHNPETWSMTEGGEVMTAEAAFQKAFRFKNYWKNGGGITVSGGEPLAQIDFLIELFKLAKAKGVHTCIDTAGAPFTREEPFFGKFKELMEVTNLLLVDVKHIDNEKHLDLTGKTNTNILDMFHYLDEIQKPIWIRHVLVPGYTADEDSLTRLDAFIKTLSNVQRVEVLPYHAMAITKYEKYGIPYRFKDVEIPDQETIQKANDLLHTAEYTGYKN